jgi:pimeloyl-ACP methyl ester carboxylesterase
VAGGISLGTFSAVHVAALGDIDRLLLLAPMHRLGDVASRHFWWLPVGLLLRHRFDNTEAAAKVRCPVLIVHGAEDEVVPAEFGEALSRCLSAPTEFVLVPGAGHNDLPLSPGQPAGDRIGAFLRGS